MEENGKEERCEWNGTGDVVGRQGDMVFQNDSEMSNGTSYAESDICKDPSVHLPKMSGHKEGTIEKMCFSEDKRMEDLTDLLRKHHVECNGNDFDDVAKDHVTIEKERDQSCLSATICNCCLSVNITTIHSEITSVAKEENITFSEESGNGKSMSENHENEFEHDAVETNESNNMSVSTNTGLPLNEKTENGIVESEAQKSYVVEFGSHSVSDGSQEACELCTTHDVKVNSKSLNIATKDRNVEITDITSIQEPLCGLCTLKASKKRKFPDYSRRENIEKIETLFKRPASSISDRSSNSNASGDSETKRKCKKELSFETDPAVLSRRQKQIDYGKNTTGYERYKKMIPKDQRGRQDPQTPSKCMKYSRRAWDGLIKTWRRKLHNWDPPKSEESDDEILSLISSSSFRTLSDDSENLNDTSSDLIAEEESAVEIETDGVSTNENADSPKTKGSQ